MLVSRDSKLWGYIEEHIKDLIADGEALLKDAEIHEKSISDYSYLVFPFSKAYEGFLKKLFLDLHLIDKAQFFGDEIRIGKILNPSFKHHEHSVYGRVGTIKDREVSEHLWTVWRNARNLVFHYYPHNFRKLSFRESENLINDIVEAMTEAVELLDTND